MKNVRYCKILGKSCILLYCTLGLYDILRFDEYGTGRNWEERGGSHCEGRTCQRAAANTGSNFLDANFAIGVSLLRFLLRHL